MENIVRLAAYRRRRKGAPPRPAAATELPRYHCTRCDADEFRLAESGQVHCAHCGALMRNIGVSSR